MPKQNNRSFNRNHLQTTNSNTISSSNSSSFNNQQYNTSNNSMNQSYYAQQMMQNPNHTPHIVANGDPSGFFATSVINPQKKTTVFVGSIDPQAPDEMIIRMLRTCGSVADWKRASGANGTMQPFGFVKFEDYESTLRAIRVMHGLGIGEKNLVVKLSADDQQKLDKYKEDKRDYLVKTGQQIVSAKNWQDQTQSSSDESLKPSQTVKEVLTQEEVQHDKSVALKLKSIVNEYDDYFKNPLLHQSVSQNFLRSTMAKHMQTRDLRNNNHSRTSEFVDKKTKEIDEQASVVKTKMSLKSGPDVENEMSDESETPETLTVNTLNKKLPQPPVAKLTYTDSQGSEVTDPVMERKLYLKKLKEKAKSYAQMLKRFEARERRQQRAYIYEENDIEQARINNKKNFNKELKFYAEYDDETMDKRNFCSRRFAYKISERDIESRNDRDLVRQLSNIERNAFFPRFTDYFDYIRGKNVENFSSAIKDDIVSTLDQEINQNTQKASIHDTNNSKTTPESIPNFKPIATTTTIMPENDDESPELSLDKEVDELAMEKVSIGTPDSSSPTTHTPGIPQLKIVINNATGHKFLDTSKHIKDMKKTLGVGGLFGPDNEINGPDVKVAKLENGSSNQETTNSAKNQMINCIIESIPDSNETLYCSLIDWTKLTPVHIKKYIYPWLVKKITEYLGEPEKVLLEFICEKLSEHCTHTDMIESLAAILDEDEASKFTADLWRLLSFILKADEANVLE